VKMEKKNENGKIEEILVKMKDDDKDIDEKV
jgi:hypothetical protein